MRRTQFERDMKEELRLHREDRAAELMAAGRSARQARRQARMEFGGSDKYEEQCRESSGFLLLDGLLADLGYAARNLARHRLLSLTVVATLAVGMGASSGLFALINLVLLRGPVVGSGFVRVYAGHTSFRANPGDPMMNSWRDYAAFRQARSFRQLSAWAASGVHADGDQLDASLYVSCNLFDVYRLERPAQGRLLEAADCDQQHPVAVIADTLAQRLFGSPAAAVGRTANFRGHPVTVVGVVTTPFAGQMDQIGAGAWLPYTLHRYLSATPEWAEQPDVPQLAVEGQSRPGVSPAAAEAELHGIAAREDAQHPELGRHQLLALTNGSIAQTPGVGTQARFGLALAVLLVTLLALIAALNVTAVLLARAHARRQEVAIRLSLGGSKARLARMLLTETTLLALIAAAGAAWIAMRLPRAAAAFLSDGTHPFTLHSLRPDWHVFVYLAALTLLVGLLTGLSPASEALRADVNETLKGRQRGLPLAGASLRLRRSLTAGQVALSLVLLLLAICFTQARAGLLRGVEADHGYAAAQLLAPEVAARGGGPGPVRGDYFDLELALAAMPRIEGVAFARALPSQPATLALATPNGVRIVAYNEVSPEYFPVVGVRLLAGRGLTDQDAGCRRAMCPAVVSQTFSRRARAGLGAVLQLASVPGRRTPVAALQVVGIAADTRGLIDDQPEAELYRAWDPARSGYRPLIRFAGPAAPLTEAAQEVLRRRFPGAIVSASTVAQLTQARVEAVSRGRLRQVQTLLLLLGISAMALTLIGLYGTFAFLLGQRAKEMGIRIAFGARARDIYRLAASAGAGPLVGGLGLGLVLYVAVAGLLQHWMSEPGGLALYFWRPGVLAGGMGLMLLAGAAAVWGPARRACATDPVAALREE